MVGLFDGLVQFPQHSHRMCLKKKSKSPGLQPWLPLPPQFPGRGMHSHGSPRQDLLHVFHQGVLCCVIAGLICSHIESYYPAITLKDLDRVLSKEVYPHYKQWCRRKGKHAIACSHRFNGARFGKESWPAYPELGSIFKAAVVKTMLYWCNDFLKEAVGRVAGAEMRFPLHIWICKIPVPDGHQWAIL